MIDVLLVVLCLECGALLVWGLLRPGRIFEFPFLAGAAFGGYLLPQFINLRGAAGVPSEALAKAVLMSVLCVAMSYAGYAWPMSRLRLPAKQLDRRTLIGISAAYAIAGLLAFALIGYLPSMVREQSQPTGQLVLLVSLSLLIHCSFAMAVLLYVRSRSFIVLGIIALDSIFLLQRIVMVGKRAILFEVLFVCCAALWFVRRKQIPRLAVVAGLVLATIVVWRAPDFRQANIDRPGQWSQLEFDVQRSIDSLRRIDLTNTNRPEVGRTKNEALNAVFMIEATSRSGDYDFGGFHWNRIVKLVLPRAVFGNLQEKYQLPETDAARELFGYRTNSWTPPTGIATAFRSFSYLGCLEFFLIGLVMRWLYDSAMRGAFLSQTLLLLVTVHAVQTMTHHTDRFLLMLAIGLLILAPVRLLASHRDPAHNLQSAELSGSGFKPVS